MKDRLIKEMKNGIVCLNSNPTNPIDKEYNDSYKNTFESTKLEELEELEKCDNVETHIFNKIKTLPIQINKLTKERYDIDTSKNYLKSAKITAKIDVINTAHSIFTDFSSEVAASKN